MAELGPDEHRGGVVEEEVGRQLLAEPRQVGGGHHQPQHAVEAGAVSPHHRVGVPPRGQQLGEVGEGAAEEGELDQDEQDGLLVPVQYSTVQYSAVLYSTDCWYRW